MFYRIICCLFWKETITPAYMTKAFMESACDYRLSASEYINCTPSCAFALVLLQHCRHSSDVCQTIPWVKVCLKTAFK